MKKLHIFWVSVILILSAGSVLAEEPVLLLFGGDNHDKFLGCLNCSKYDSSSVWNKYGEHGSKYNSDSIWNKYGTYGSKYNSLSPWNKYSSDGPAVVDPDGNFYGHFSRNKYNNQTKVKWLVWILDNYEYLMENFDEIRDKLILLFVLPKTEISITSYEIEVSHNDELFIINSEKFEAKTYCFNMEEGDEVIFLEGSPNGICISAEWLNLRTKNTCSVWCE